AIAPSALSGRGNPGTVNANLALISVPGDFAAAEARKALRAGPRGVRRGRDASGASRRNGDHDGEIQQARQVPRAGTVYFLDNVFRIPLLLDERIHPGDGHAIKCAYDKPAFYR
ncbi:MAG TPA: hypothetical protein EYO97_13865, partial [Gemmatimonadetes bacterium]|nr:hypothetical protein [Gemmatimonadota bacterium]